MKNFNAGIVAGLVLLVYSITIFVLSFDFDYYTNFGPGPGLLPMWLSGGLIILSILYILESMKKGGIKLRDILPKGRPLGGILTTLAVVPLFMLIVNTTGFVIACILVLFFTLRREYKWYWGLGISVFTSVILFYVFQTLLGVPLPVNSFGW